MFRDEDPQAPTTIGMVQRVWEENHKLWKTIRNTMIIALVCIGLGTGWGLWAFQQEQKERTEQFCGLIINRYNDVVSRYNETVSFLNSPIGQEDTGLNQVIRERSLPALQQQLTVERDTIPTFCIDLDNTPEIKKITKEEIKPIGE